VPLTRLVVFVNHVTGVPAGAHSYDAASHTLTPLPGPPPHPFLQRVYTLNNHNLEQASAVLVVLARPHAVLRAAGPRGYRLLNAEVGAVAQATYLAAAALGTGCGAALGFDYEAMAERLVTGTGTVTTGTVTTDTETTADTVTTDTDTKPLLVLMTGHERPCRPDFDTTLVPHRPDVAHPDGSARP
jgi:nitroreductase